MSADLLRTAAKDIRRDARIVAEDALFDALADWLEFVAEGRESLDGIDRIREVLAERQGISFEARQASKLFLDTERHAVAVAHAYLGDDATRIERRRAQADGA